MSDKKLTEKKSTDKKTSKKNILEIKNITATCEEKEILKETNLTIERGKVHAIMGPNGSGKSTLSKVLTGHPDYEVTGGEILFKGESILGIDPDEIALKGLFLAFQYPVEVPGVNNASFLRMAYNAQLKHNGKEECDPLDFEELIQDKLKILGIDDSFLERSVNQGFSGGEKKRNEILQLLVLNPECAVLDETDSGLDIDALKVVSDAVNQYRNEQNAVLVITHYQRLLNYIQPDVVHIMVDGKIVKTGDKSLAIELEEKGYEGIAKEIAKDKEKEIPKEIPKEIAG